VHFVDLCCIITSEVLVTNQSLD